MTRGRKIMATQEEVLEAACDVDDLCFGCAEVAAALDIGAERTRAKLDGLAEDGVLDAKRIGGVAVYWFNGH